MYPFEVQAAQVAGRLLALAADMDVDSAVFAAGMANALGSMAAVLDREAGRQDLDDRLHSFVARVKGAYSKVRHTAGERGG